MKIAFLVNDLHLSGGINVAVKHASGLSTAHGHDVYVVVSSKSGWHEWRYPELKNVTILNIQDACGVDFDIVVPTWWETIFNVGLLRAKSVVWFMQSLEDRFYSVHNPMQWLAQAAYAIDVPVITEASWIRDFLIEQNPFRSVGLALNGIDKDVFTPGSSQQPSGGPLRIMIEGSAGAVNKGVRQCFEVLQHMTELCETTWVSPSGATADAFGVSSLAGPLSFEEMAEVYRNSDVLLKLSRVEGMFGPPLEAFHCGATAVVTPVTGAEEYVRDGYNSVVVGWDDVRGTAKVLDRLALNRDELERLRAGALETASRWIGWPESTEMFHSELIRLSNGASSVSTEQVRAQASVLRSLRVPIRLMHENAISTLKSATGAFRRIDELTTEIRTKDDLLRELAHVHQEKEWWDCFQRRLPVRILLKLRRGWRKVRRR